VQAAADMFVMVLDVHKWVAMPAVAARARQAPAGTSASGRWLQHSMSSTLAFAGPFTPRSVVGVSLNFDR
jgi:hypothetical protein